MTRHLRSRLRLSPVLLGILAWGGCGRGGGGSDAPISAAASAALSARGAAKRADSYMVYYGAWDDARIRRAQGYPLVIVHPTNGAMTRDQVAAIQGGTDPSNPASLRLFAADLLS